jgi:hypothetical protein
MGGHGENFVFKPTKALQRSQYLQQNVKIGWQLL